MMKKNKLFIAALAMCVSCISQAQQSAVKMVADGHYFGARQQFERFLSEAEAGNKYVGEAEALSLVCDYVLNTPGTADKIGSWLESNQASQYASILGTLQRNQLIKEGRVDEAITLFYIAEERGDDLLGNTTLAYPLTSLSDEAEQYNLALFRMAGEDLYGKGNYALAIEYLEKGEKTRNSLYKLGMCYLKKDCCYDKAAACFSQSADTEKDELAQNAWLHAGLSYLKTGNKKMAQTSFQQASLMDADKTIREEALYNYALTLHEGTSTGFGESVTVFERFLNEFPRSSHATNVSQYLTEVYFTTKNYSAALQSINKIKQPNTEILTAKQRVLYNLGIQEFTSGAYQNALMYANQSIALGKKDAEAYAESYFLKGESEYRIGNYQLAANDLQQAINLGASTPSKSLKNNDYAIYSLGYTYFKQKKYAAALNQFQKFVGNKSNGAPLISDAYNRMGDCCLDTRSYDKAYSYYQSAISTDVSHGDYSLLQQAYIQGLRGNYDQKVALIEQMTAQYTKSEYTSDALFEQGRAYVHKGDVLSASETFNSIIQRFPQSANARKASNELAMLLAESGKTEEAISAYKKVINDYPTSEEAQTALSNLKDIYTSQGRVNEYMDLAQKMGKTFCSDELDEMVHDAAMKAMSNGNYAQAQQYYTQLRNQTITDSYRLNAQAGMLRSAFANKDYKTTIASATEILDDANKLSPEVKAEARLCRAESYMQLGNSKDAVSDLQLLAQDTQTVYGAQATVKLAQYAYSTKQYESAETILTNFIDSGTPHTYWLAQSFITLSDVYAAKGQTVEARSTLLSLKANYTENPEITKLIEERLNNLK